MEDNSFLFLLMVYLIFNNKKDEGNQLKDEILNSDLEDKTKIKLLKLFSL